MKRYFLFLTIAITGLFYSCGDDFLDVAPLTQLSDATFWNTPAEVQMALTGVYAPFSTNTAWRNVIHFDTGSDNADDGSWGYGAFVSGQMTPESASTHFWSYDIIRRANNFISKIDKANIDQATIDKYKAEARFLRAYDYFRKTMLYGDVPLVTELTFPDEKRDRTPVNEVQRWILDELEDISDILPVQNNVQSGGHVQSGSALALKSRLELYLGNYSQAMADAQAVIDMGVFELDEWPTMFKRYNFNSPEAIFTINFADNFLPGEFIPIEQLPTSYNGNTVYKIS